MMSLFLSQLLMLYHLPGHVLTAPQHYLEKAIPDPITMKGNSGCVCNGNSLWAAQGTLPSASEPSCRVGVMPPHLIPSFPHEDTEMDSTAQHSRCRGEEAAMEAAGRREGQGE